MRSIKPILKAIKHRYSPTTFTNKDIEKKKIDTVIEAARLAPSAFNNQPWRYLFIHQDSSSRKQVEKSLSFGNGWAKKAPYLVVVFAREKDDKPFNNIKYHIFDTALSVMSLVIEAENQNLKTHQMAGFNPKKVRQAVHIPTDYDILIILALGYESKVKPLSDKLYQKVKDIVIKQRHRKPAHRIAFFDSFANKRKP